MDKRLERKRAFEAIVTLRSYCQEQECETCILRLEEDNQNYNCMLKEVNGIPEFLSNYDLEVIGKRVVDKK